IENSTQEICAGTVPNDLQLIESVGKVLYWQMSETLDFAKFTNISKFTTTLTGADLGPLNQTTYIRAVVESGNCGQAFSNIVTILIKSTTWTGTTWTSDLPNNLTSAIFAADYNTSSHGAITACGCTVESGIKLTVASGTTMILQNDIINNGNITVESDANLIQLSSTGKYTGDPLGFKVQRVANIKRLDYVYWSSPVTGQKLKGFSPGTLNNRFLTYNEWNDKFTAVPDVNASFHPAKGYAIRASNSQPVSATDWMGNFVGTPNNGEIPFALELTTAGNGYNLVGNPYPSNINFDYLVNDESNSNSIYSLAYFWTNTNANGPMQGSGYPKDGLINNYAIYNGTGGVPATGPATNETPENPIPAVSLPRPDGIILVGQAFIVKAKKVGDLKFQNNIKVSVPGKFIDKGSSVDRFWLNLTTPLKVQTTTLIGYKASATNGFELDYDAPLMVLGADALYSILDDRRLAIQGRAAFVNTDLISLGTNHYEAGTYTISLGHTEGIFANGQNIYLKDKQTGTVTNLSVTDYMFTVDKGLTEGRFEIVFKADTVLGTDSSRKESLIVYRDGADFVVRSQTKKITGVEVYDTGGRLVYSLTAHAMQVVVPAEQLPNSVYILKIMQSETSTSRKILK
ncbi:MAG: T9SS type A sorting domain-containing protein, partial [Chitinophagales bacterium]|nr:T9SS type A sorting domain-containing protein [Chitinophagales bacterium]